MSLSHTRIEFAPIPRSATLICGEPLRVSTRLPAGATSSTAWFVGPGGCLSTLKSLNVRVEA